MVQINLVFDERWIIMKALKERIQYFGDQHKVSIKMGLKDGFWLKIIKEYSELYRKFYELKKEL